jgi:hypothetical protein
MPLSSRNGGAMLPHEGPFYDRSPTGKRIAVSGINIYRCRERQDAAEWDSLRASSGVFVSCRALVNLIDCAKQDRRNTWGMQIHDAIPRTMSDDRTESSFR